jgi:3',5'-cyclic AMP phosphodiesterase CpdA
MTDRPRPRRLVLWALLLAATGLLVSAPVAQTAARADGEVPSYVFASAPDLLNDDIADLRVSPYWRDGMANGTNRSYESSLDVFLSDIRDRGARDVLVAGDLVRGHWGLDRWKTGVFGRVSTGAQRRAALRLAANVYYPAWTQRFTRNGLRAFPAVGDHDIGDNPWRTPTGKAGLRGYRSYAVSDGWYDFKRRHVGLFKKMWAKHFTDGGARYPKRPTMGTAERTAYAKMLAPEVLLVTVDTFDSTGGKVRGRLDQRQLAWLDRTLAKAGKNGVDWVIVQGHLPVATPVRSRDSSAMTYQGGTRSAFWKTMRKHEVDLYLSGEVHHNTAIRKNKIVQVSHGGLFRSGQATYLLGRVYADRLELDLRGFNASLAFGKPAVRPWQTDLRHAPNTATYHAGSQSLGTLTLTADHRAVNRTGLLGVYNPRVPDPVSPVTTDRRAELGPEGPALPLD